MLNLKQLSAVAGVAALAVSAVVGCGLTEKKMMYGKPQDASKVSAIEATQFASRSRDDISALSETEKPIWESYQLCGSSTASCEAMTERVLGFDLNTSLKGDESVEDAMALRRRIRKEESVKNAYVSLVKDQNRDTVMPLVYRAWNLSFQDKLVGGINSSDPLDSALYVVVTLSSLKEDNGGTLENMTPDNVNKLAKDSEFTQIYNEIASVRTDLKALAGEVAAVEGRLTKMIEQERQARESAIAAETQARIEQVATETKARQEAFESLMTSIREEADMRSKMDSYGQSYTDWSKAMTHLEVLRNNARKNYEFYQAEFEKAQAEFNAAQAHHDEQLSRWYGPLLDVQRVQKNKLEKAREKFVGPTQQRDDAKAVYERLEAQVAELGSKKPSNP